MGPRCRPSIRKGRSTGRQGAPRIAAVVLIACPGLDHAGRGFETLARESFEALRAQGGIDVRLVKGSGARAPGELVARAPRRDGAFARRVASALRRGAYGPYEVEQAGFLAGLLPLVTSLRPDSVFLSDLLTSRALAAWRRLTRADFGLVVSNGGPWPPARLRHADHVQELTPAALERALADGASPERHVMLPLGVAMAPRFEPATAIERARLRASLELPAERRIVLSVGALTFSDKRLDYLIEEFAALPEPRPLLVLLGAQEPEAHAVRALAARLLGPDGYVIRTVSSDKVGAYYRAADQFALASLVESFGRVMVEALSHGLPCVAHDGPVQRYVLGPHGRLGDLRERGELTRLLAAGVAPGAAPEAAAERYRHARERFGWGVLAPRYAELLALRSPR